MSTSDKKIPQAAIAPFGLRMQPALKLRVEAAAKKNERSLNAEIVATLEEKYPEPVSFGEFMAAWMQQFYKDGWDIVKRNALIEELRDYVANHSTNIETIVTSYDANARKFTVELKRPDMRRLAFSLEDVSE